MQVYDASHMPKVAREDMNHTHEEEIALVNRVGELIEAVEQGEDNAELLAALDAWLAHTRAHFDNEHRIMEEVGFPAYQVHRGEHERVLQGLTTLIENYKANGDWAPLKTFVFETWPDWFENHVNTMDFATAHFAQMAASGKRPF